MIESGFNRQKVNLAVSYLVHGLGKIRAEQPRHVAVLRLVVLQSCGRNAPRVSGPRVNADTLAPKSIRSIA